MRYTSNRAAVCLGCGCVLLSLSTTAWGQQASLAAQDTSGDAGSEVELRISLTTGASDISSLRFELSLPSQLSYVSTATGPASADAGKTASAAPNNAGVLVLVFGLNDTAIGPGVIATVRLAIAASATGTLAVQLTVRDAASPDGQLVTIRGQDALVRVNEPGPICGDDLVEGNETCDPPSSCPQSCDDGDVCTRDRLVGSAADCNAACAADPITQCGDDDGCCPAGCNHSTDNDCAVEPMADAASMPGDPDAAPPHEVDAGVDAASKPVDPDAGPPHEVDVGVDGAAFDAGPSVPAADTGQGRPLLDARQNTAADSAVTTTGLDARTNQAATDLGPNGLGQNRAGAQSGDTSAKKASGGCAVAATSDPSAHAPEALGLALLVLLLTRPPRRRVAPIASPPATHKLSRHHLFWLLIGMQLIACRREGAVQRERETTAIAGDLDNDRNVTTADLQRLVNVLLGTEADSLAAERADFDSNGDTNTADLQQLVNLLLSCGGGDDACTCKVGADPVLADNSGGLGGTDRFATDTHIVDIDNDGDLDIVWANQFNSGNPPLGGIDISEQQEDGSFVTTALGDETTIGAWTFLELVDVTNDGFVDIVATRPAISTTQIRLFANDGSGGFAPAEEALPVVNGASDGVMFGGAVAADIDGDNDQDLILPISFDAAFASDKPNVLLLNNGDGTFRRDSEGRLPTIADNRDFTFCIAAGDVNGDGAADIFLGEAESQQRLLINDGTGRFSDQTLDDGNGTARLPTTRLRGYECKMFDLEEDGDLDIVVLNDVSTTSGLNVTQAPHIFSNDGSGHFTGRFLPTSAGGPFDSRDVAFGDINGDKLPDLVLVNDNFTDDHEGTAFEVHLGQCDGSFKLGAGLPQSNKGLLGIALGDLDRDGDLDIAAAVNTPDPQGDLRNLLLINQQ